MNKSREKKLGDYDGSDRRNLHKVWWCFCAPWLTPSTKKVSMIVFASLLPFESRRLRPRRANTQHSGFAVCPRVFCPTSISGAQKNCAGARGTHDLVSTAKKTKQNGFSYSRICLPSTALLTCRITSKWKHEWWTVARNENESKKKSWCCENVNKRLRPSRKRWCN